MLVNSGDSVIIELCVDS